MEDSGLTREDVDRLLTFEGFGNKKAPYWFLGMEEGGGSMEQLLERAKSFGPVEHLHCSLSKIGLDTKYHYVAVWRSMSMLIMAIQGTPGWQEKSSALEYQATKLGRADGDTFLTELMPLPCPNMTSWPYQSIFPTKSNYYESVRPRRINWLRSEFDTFRPRYVICYGKGNWPYYKEIFSDVEFWSEPIENVLIGQREHGTVIMTRFLSPDLVSTALIEHIAEMINQDHNYE